MKSFCLANQEYRRWSDRVTRVERALFGGYIFCRVNPAAAGKIVTAAGVFSIVDEERGPLAIPSAEIEAVQWIVETSLTVESGPRCTWASARGFRPGAPRDREDRPEM